MIIRVQMTDLCAVTYETVGHGPFKTIRCLSALE